MRSYFKVWIALAIVVFATSAFASTVTFSYGDGSTLAVTGTLNGNLNSGVFTATSGSGFYNLTPMTLVPVGTGGTGFSFNDQVYFPPVGGNSVDLYGLVFDVAGLGYANLCATTGCANDSNNGYTNLTYFGGNTAVEATFNSPTPEPSTLLMVGSGLLGLAGLARKRLFN